MAIYEAKARMSDIDLINTDTDRFEGASAISIGAGDPIHPEAEGRKFAHGALIGLAVCVPVWAGVVALILQGR